MEERSCARKISPVSWWTVAYSRVSTNEQTNKSQSWCWCSVITEVRVRSFNPESCPAPEQRFSTKQSGFDRSSNSVDYLQSSPRPWLQSRSQAGVLVLVFRFSVWAPKFWHQRPVRFCVCIRFPVYIHDTMTYTSCPCKWLHAHWRWRLIRMFQCTTVC